MELTFFILFTIAGELGGMHEASETFQLGESLAADSEGKALLERVYEW